MSNKPRRRPKHAGAAQRTLETGRLYRWATAFAPTLAEVDEAKREATEAVTRAAGARRRGRVQERVASGEEVPPLLAAMRRDNPDAADELDALEQRWNNERGIVIVAVVEVAGERNSVP